MDNTTILKNLEAQRDNLLLELQDQTISGLYRQHYEDVKAGRLTYLHVDQNEVLAELKELSLDTANDHLLKATINKYFALDNDDLVLYFAQELNNLFKEIIETGKGDQIQAMFIEYDHYYHFCSSVTCYGRQNYPEITTPRYILGEYDHTKEIMRIDGVNFEPAWPNCKEYEDFDYIGLGFKFETLFQLHSRVLLHRSLDLLVMNKKLEAFPTRPLYFFINEHGCGEMSLYIHNG